MLLVYITSSGRTKSLKNFVKKETEKLNNTYVEIDLYLPVGFDTLPSISSITNIESWNFRNCRILTIRRTLHIENNGSKWTVNGKNAKESFVSILISSLSIDVDNLCSFMPQDKVGNFTKCTPEEVIIIL
jgi:chromosome segregation ATPase